MIENNNSLNDEAEQTILRDKVNVIVENIKVSVDTRFNEYEVKINKIKDALEKKKEARQKRIKRLQSVPTGPISDNMTDIINDLKIN